MKARQHSSGPNLFDRRAGATDRSAPLADRMRPRTLAEFVGQTHVVGPSKLLHRAVLEDRVPSMVLWGPPGVGKTSLARVISESTKAEFVSFSAVLGTVAELRERIGEAKERKRYNGTRTILFVDEIHRFNKSQQDAFLPHVEDGTILLIGATTENPSFSVNAALLSRAKVFRLEALETVELASLLSRALSDGERGLGKLELGSDDDALSAIAQAARGDARRALNMLEVIAQDVKSANRQRIVFDDVRSAEEHKALLFDKSGDEHYGITSAFIKSMRGSDPDAAVYWMMRLIEGGDDPLFILRRMIIFASEDIGNADPRALLIATGADAAYRRLGMPEGLYALGQAVTYLASAPKSNAANAAWHKAKDLVEKYGALPVPKKLRPASTKLAKEMGHGADYKYAHDFEGGVVEGETYLPDELVGTVLYEPAPRGEEVRIKARLDVLRSPKSPTSE